MNEPVFFFLILEFTPEKDYTNLRPTSWVFYECWVINGKAGKFGKVVKGPYQPIFQEISNRTHWTDS